MVKKYCKVNIHRDRLVATVLDGESEEKQTQNFQNIIPDIERLKQ